MNPTLQFHTSGENAPLEVLWEDGERVYCRTSRSDVDGARQEFMAVLCAEEHPKGGSISRLVNEFELREYLDDNWAVRPLELVRERGQTMLVLEYPRGEPLSRLIGPEMEVESFMRFAVALSSCAWPITRARPHP